MSIEYKDGLANMQVTGPHANGAINICIAWSDDDGSCDFEDAIAPSFSLNEDDAISLCSEIQRKLKLPQCLSQVGITSLNASPRDPMRHVGPR